MPSRPDVDRNVCGGYGECVKVAPEVFRLDDDVAVVIEPLDESVDPRTIELAVAGCPTQALRLIDPA